MQSGVERLKSEFMFRRKLIRQLIRLHDKQTEVIFYEHHSL